jgi:hypothetical protein
VNFDGNNNDRPNLLSDPRLDPNRSRPDVLAAWFNTASFGPAAAGTSATRDATSWMVREFATSTWAFSGASR